MSKKKNKPFHLFMESVGLYFSNFDKFVKYMTFPVLGQVLGLILIFVLTFIYSSKMPLIIEKFPKLASTEFLIVSLLLIILPGLLIFIKSFWEYLVAYGAVNSMFANMIKSGKVYDFDAHTELIKRRSLSFIGLWFLFSVFSLVAIIPFFWVPACVLIIYYVLVFQIFTFEPNLSPIGCVKRSFQLVKGHFLSTLLLFSVIGALTYVLIPQIVSVFFEYTRLTLFMTKIILPIVSIFQLTNVNEFLSYIYLPPITVEYIANAVVSVIITQIFIQYTLPLRSILWSMWYKVLNNGKLGDSSEIKSNKKRTIKKTSEKLMEESHKKFATKKIDRNILKRAMEKDEN